MGPLSQKIFEVGRKKMEGKKSSRKESEES
jgi:hypothetical protein